MNRARYRGLSRVVIQGYLSVIASNLKKYIKVIDGKIKDGVTVTLAKLAALGYAKGILCPDTG